LFPQTEAFKRKIHEEKKIIVVLSKLIFLEFKIQKDINTHKIHVDNDFFDIKGMLDLIEINIQMIRSVICKYHTYL
jgi:hypothetical protein